MITQDSIDRLRNSIDIVDLVSNYTHVKKVGSTYMALCPFHDDKVSSMSVSRNLGLYYCHACGAKGDAIKFLMEHEKLDFVSAIEYLARFFNVTLEYSDDSNYKKRSDILESLSDFYHNNIFKQHEILSYLKSRGIDREDIIEFKIGYSGSSFETIKFIQDHNLSKEEAQELGMISSNNDRFYAKFANRIMFPIYSANGAIVGFGGRTLDSNVAAKYINSSQSKLFNKSKILYGYYHAKHYIYKQHSMIICEGYLDVIMLHKAGFKNAVATLGTSLNDEHLYLLNKESPRILMCYDGDKAGIKAALRASRFLSKHSMDGGVILLDNGLDPADMILHGKANDFAKKMSRPVPFPIFVCEDIMRSHDLQNPMDKQKAMHELSEFLNTLGSASLRVDYRKIFANMMGVSEQYIPIRGESSNNARYIKDPEAINADIIREGTILFNMLDNRENYLVGAKFLRDSYFKVYGREFIEIVNGSMSEERSQEFKLAQFEIRDFNDFCNDIRKFIKLHIYELKRKVMYNPHIDEQSRQRIVLYLLGLCNSINKGQLVLIDEDLSRF